MCLPLQFQFDTECHHPLFLCRNGTREASRLCTDEWVVEDQTTRLIEVDVQRLTGICGLTVATLDNVSTFTTLWRGC